jgi:ATP-dependent DNA ligase
MDLPVMPPVAPMLAKPVSDLPEGPWSFEPKWDGFRTIVFRDGDEVELGSRRERPMTRYFPEVVEAVRANLPARCVVDAELVVPDADGRRLDFDALLLRIHPAASRVRLLAEQTPARLVAFDLLALGEVDWMAQPFARRRAALEEALAGVRAPVHLTPATTDRELAAEWLSRFEGAGLDGLVAKALDGTYEPDRRVWRKVKHQRTADCVVAGYRLHKRGEDLIGSLLLGLYTQEGELAMAGVIGAFPMEQRRELFAELQLLVTGFEGHPWDWGLAARGRGLRPRLAGVQQQPLEPGQGAVVHTAAARAGGRGPLRPPGGPPVPSHRPVRALASRPRPPLLHVRSAGRDGQFRPGRGPGDRDDLIAYLPPQRPGPSRYAAVVCR